MGAARFLTCAAGALAVAGCLAPSPETTDPDADPDTSDGLVAFFARDGATRGTAPLTRASLADGDVVVAGPEGYCIDAETRSTGPQRGFAVIASCHILIDGRSGREVPPMLVTVTVGPRGDTTDLPTPEALAKAAGAQIIGSETTSGRVAVHLDSGGETMFAGSDPRYWRGAFLQGERLVGLALYAPENSSLAGERGKVMLRRIKDRTASLSPGNGQSEDATGPDSISGLFSRLFKDRASPD